MTRKHLIAPLALAAVLGACLDNQSVLPPTTNPALVDPMFASYAALGNSITAGFQSGGINDSTQMQSYAVLLAEQMGLAINGTIGGDTTARAVFNVPLLNKPGCPPPLVNVFTQELLGPAVPGGCALRNPAVPNFLNNLAIPGAAVLDVFDPLGAGNSSNALTTFIGGGQSQVENARRVMPSFVTVWIGNNDALGAVLDPANPGNPQDVTSIPTFADRYTAMMDSLDALGTIQGGALIGVVQVGLAPYLTQGRVWKQFEVTGFDPLFAFKMDSVFRSVTGGTPLPFTANIFDVAANCLAGTPIPSTSDTAWTSVPFAVGGPILATANARATDPNVATHIIQVGLGAWPVESLPAPTVLNCSDANAVTNGEMLNLFGAIATYNAVIEQAAADRDWIYVDPNVLLAHLDSVPGALLPFPAFPGLPGVTEEMSTTTPFGTALSLDGIHPSASTHVLVANALIQAINAKYGTSIPAIQ
jgi:hypothetical protein